MEKKELINGIKEIPYLDRIDLGIAAGLLGPKQESVVTNPDSQEFMEVKEPGSSDTDTLYQRTACTLLKTDDASMKALQNGGVESYLDYHNVPKYYITKNVREMFISDEGDFFKQPIIHSYVVPESLYSDIIDEPLKAILANGLPGTTDEYIQTNKLNGVFYGITIQGNVTVKQIKTFMSRLNEFANEGLVEYGTVAPPLMMPLALISPIPRAVIYFIAFSKFTKEELNEKLGYKYFNNEGELPNDSETERPFNWITGMITQPGQIVNESEPMQLMSVEDRRQYAIQIFCRSSLVQKTDRVIPIEVKLIDGDDAESLFNQIEAETNKYIRENIDLFDTTEDYLLTDRRLEITRL